MLTRSTKIMLIALAAVAGNACESSRCPGCPSDEEVLAQAGAVRLTQDEARTHVSGKTEGWVAGGAYYNPDGNMQARYRGAWEVEDDGSVCYQLPKWEKRCHFYMRKEDEVIMLDEGKNIGVRPVYEGNRVNSLGRTLSTGPRAKVN